LILQVYGMPTSGKTTFSKQFIKDNPLWTWLDVAKWNIEPSNWLIAETTILDKIKQEPNRNYIVESVSGFWDLKSKNILFKCDMPDLIKRHEYRRKILTNKDLDYYNGLMSQSIKSDIIINTSVLDTYEQIMMKIKYIMMRQ